jgi:signal transduction histidine kinase
MDAILRASIFALIVAHGVTVVYVYLRSKEKETSLYWIMASLGFSALAIALYLPDDGFQIGDLPGRNLFLILIVIAAFISYGVVIIQDILNPDRRQFATIAWLALGGIWVVLLLVAGFATGTFMAGENEWLVDIFIETDVTAVLTLVGFAVTSLVLFGIEFYIFYKARLPEIANQSLFWVIDGAVIGLGALMLISGTPEVAALGSAVLLAGMMGGTYTLSSHRVFDVRSALLLAVRTLSFVFVAAILVFLALYLVRESALEPDLTGTIVMIGIALLIAALYVPLRQGIEYVIKRLTSRTDPDPSQITREYSAVVSEAVELDALLQAATGTLNHLMKVRGSCLILLNSTFKVKNAVELLVMWPGSPLDQKTGYLSIESPIYAALAAKRKPLSQFDIEFAPEYRKISEDERQFFRQLYMSAYAPVILENALIGVLACGPKLNDMAFYPRDLELLATLAQQTGIAVRNARLVDDLQHLNKSMQTLNRTLKNTNEQLNRMDAVKTDFVTIASHELRTPLAQIRGYTDIVDALNEQGMLDRDQTYGLVANLRKATERMEELIAAMLDVSQLDVDAMDLRFTETSAESLVRMAIEPLTDAIKQRKLTLSARGLRGLPALQADLQRLVQAFRNIIVNAIKFTPDGGRIAIKASLQEDEDDVDKILIEIKDTGVGIDKQNLEMIFKKFFRAYDPSLHSTGTYKFLGAGPGLGLTIARGVIEGHGGKVWAESPGHNMDAPPGATFYVLLPVNTPEDARRVLTFEGAAADNALREKENPNIDTQMKPPRSRVKGVETSS